MNSVVESEIGQVDRILILGWGLIGDLFIRIPLIEALKDRFPHAAITVVVDPPSVAVLENHPACDQVIAFSREKRPLIKYVARFVALALRLRNADFNLCINLYCGGSSPWITWLSNADIRISFDHTPALRWSNNLMVPRPSFCNNWTLDFARMLRPLGISSNKILRGAHFYCSEEAKHFAKALLLSRGQQLIAINLGAGADEKRWPVARFVELAMKVNHGYGIRPLVFTNPGMESLADEFVEQYSGDVVHVPLLSLDKVAALMQHCDYVISGDTALMHLAFALKRPTLVLFTHTRPEPVAPVGVHYVSCFVEGHCETDPCGNLMGTVDIPLDEVYRQFCNLVRFTSNVNDGLQVSLKGKKNDQ